MEKCGSLAGLACPALPWGATITPPTSGLCCSFPEWWCRAAQPNAKTTWGCQGSGLYIQHAAGTVQLYFCLCSKYHFSDVEALAQTISGTYILLPSQFTHDPPSLTLSCSCFPLHFSSLISTSSLPHLSFQTVTSCFLQSQSPFLFLVLSFNLSTWCSVTTRLYLSIEHWLLVILAPASWWKSCHKVTLRIKLNFSAIFFFPG